jgi:hypothetical protein
MMSVGGSDWAGLPVIATVARVLCHTGRIRDGTPLTDSTPRG